MDPAVGRIVHYFPGPNDRAAHANGQGPDDPIPAVVVRVWDETTVNLRVLTDSTETHWRTSVKRADGPSGLNSWWNWPPRV